MFLRQFLRPTGGEYFKPQAIAAACRERITWMSCGAYQCGVVVSKEAGQTDMSPMSEILPAAERTRVEMASAMPIAKQEELNFDLRRKMCKENVAKYGNGRF